MVARAKKLTERQAWALLARRAGCGGAAGRRGHHVQGEPACPRCHGTGYERLAESFDNCREPHCGDTFRPWWIEGWDAINGKRAPWASNPWVFALTFRRLA